MAFFLDELRNQGHLESVHVTIANIGSRKISDQDDYGHQVWGKFAPNLTILGFDADPKACEEANALFEQSGANWNEFHLPVAIGEKRERRTLYMTHNPMCSSLLPPNEPLLDRFVGLSELAGLSYTDSIDVVSLDDFCAEESVEEIDFLQIDVQGLTLEVLKGSQNLLSQSVLAIQAEVEFAPLYSGEALFPEVDIFMREQGFVLFDLLPPHRGQRSPLHSQNRPGQVLWTDVFYLRDPLSEQAPKWLKTPEMIFKMACIADALDFIDYAFELLEYLTLKCSKQNDRYDFKHAILLAMENISETSELNQLPMLQNLLQH
jgi:FkbM family methyltransferase